MARDACERGIIVSVRTHSGIRLGKGLDDHRGIGDTIHIYLLDGNTFVLPHQRGTFFAYSLPPTTSLRNSWEQLAKDSIYYSHAWLDLLTQLYRYSVIPLTSKNSTGQITGYLPVCSMHSPITGRRLVALPFSDYCPLLAADDASANDLINQAVCLAQEQNAKYLELRTGINDIVAKRSDLAEGNLQQITKRLGYVCDRLKA